MNYEGSARPSPEVTSPYESIGHAELIDAFYESEGNPDIGKELSVRLFEHAGLTEDPRTKPLVGRDGAQVREDGRPLSLADYINYAAKHHFEALESILDFLDMKPGDQDYEAMRAAILDRLNTSGS